MKRLSLIASILALTLCHAGTLRADTTITYQGRLDSGGQPHTGTVGMVFELYDQQSGGTQQGPTFNESVQVTDGLFNAELDFGGQAYEAGRWLSITVNGQLLSPRQRITGAPFALRAPGHVMHHQYEPSSSDVADGDSTTVVDVELELADECGDGSTRHELIAHYNGIARMSGSAGDVAFAGTQILLPDENIDLSGGGSVLPTAANNWVRTSRGSFVGPMAITRAVDGIEPGDLTIRVDFENEDTPTMDALRNSLVLHQFGWTCGEVDTTTVEAPGELHNENEPES